MTDFVWFRMLYHTLIDVGVVRRLEASNAQTKSYFDRLRRATKTNSKTYMTRRTLHDLHVTRRRCTQYTPYTCMMLNHLTISCRFLTISCNFPSLYIYIYIYSRFGRRIFPRQGEGEWRGHKNKYII